MNKTIKILFIGDITGRPGRRAVREILPKIKEEQNFDYVFANCENTASGNGITYTKYLELMEMGIDYLTSGNHIFDKEEIIEKMKDENTKIIRPANYPESEPGRGMAILGNILLLNLEGRVFMDENLSDPFATAEKIVSENPDKIIIIDFHAEATSEKIALSYYLDGKVSAIIGTHTHVQTADPCIRENGTAYITDVGMCGPAESVLGVKKEIIIENFLTGQKKSHKVASGEAIFNAVSIEIEKETKKALKIKSYSELTKS